MALTLWSSLMVPERPCRLYSVFDVYVCVYVCACVYKTTIKTLMYLVTILS